jgi:hypothetical protein
MADAPSAESPTTASATGSCVRKDVRAQLGVVIAGTHVGRRSVGLGPKMREVIGPKSGSPPSCKSLWAKKSTRRRLLRSLFDDQGERVHRTHHQTSSRGSVTTT